MPAFDVGILGLDKTADGVLVTFMFKPLSGGDKVALNKMMDEVEREFNVHHSGRSESKFRISKKFPADFNCSS